MSKVLVLNFSPRKKGNCRGITDKITGQLKDKGVEVVNVQYTDSEIRPCKGCDACKKKDFPTCAQKDDFEKLIPVLDECDGIIFAAPVYFGQIPGPAKIFIDRMYCFFNPRVDHPMFTVKEQKKAGIVFTCGGGDPEVYAKQAEWVGNCLRCIGVTEYATVVQNNLNTLWNEDNDNCKVIMKKATGLADWIIK